MGGGGGGGREEHATITKDENLQSVVALYTFLIFMLL